VSINLKGREPQGIVDPRDYEKLRDELFEMLSEFKDPDRGTSPIRKIYRKEEVLSGRFLDTAPVRLLVPAPLYSLTHAKTMVEDADWLSGDHRLEGVLVATGPEIKPGPLQETAELIDLGPTAMAALGVQSSIARDGKVLRSLVGEAQLSVMDAGPGGHDATSEAGLTSTEETEIEEHLRGLGYVE
jgi:predicted AlkP superfamily phosphohydrolase/phosphomutase